ncbi:MAG: energy transducer TonB [Acidobacteriota bacterium]
MSVEVYSSSLIPNADSRRANRAITWSIALHVVAVATAFLLPREWFAKKPAPAVMTITLGGVTAGPKSTGTESMGGRAVEQVAPPPKRPEPVPEPKAPPAPAMPTRTPSRTAETAPSKTPKPPPMPPTRPPVTGQRITAGNTPVDTGARGQGAGLTFGGTAGTGGDTDLQDFCCQDYLTQLLSTIDSVWNKNQPESGKTVLKFTIHRNGSIDPVIVERSSGFGLLDRAARAALQEARLLPLPAEYKKDTLTIHLTFPYGTQ